VAAAGTRRMKPVGASTDALLHCTIFALPLHMRAGYISVVRCSKYPEERIFEVMTHKSRASTQLRKIPATKVAAMTSAKKVTPAAAEPVVSVTDVISKTIQQPMTSAQGQEASDTKVAVIEAVERITPAVEPVVSVIDAISDTITTTADIVAAVAEEEVRPITATKTAEPNSRPGMKTMITSTEDFVELGQANMEAFVKSGQIWTAGMQEQMKQFATTTKASFDEFVATFKAISSAKSVTEAVELQSKFATSVVEKIVVESNNLINTSIKLTEQTLAPITARVTDAVEIFGKTA
jgi:phasin family protein